MCLGAFIWAMRPLIIEPAGTATAPSMFKSSEVLAREFIAFLAGVAVDSRIHNDGDFGALRHDANVTLQSLVAGCLVSFFGAVGSTAFSRGSRSFAGRAAACLCVGSRGLVARCRSRGGGGPHY